MKGKNVLLHAQHLLTEELHCTLRISHWSTPLMSCNKLHPIRPIKQKPTRDQLTFLSEIVHWDYQNTHHDHHQTTAFPFPAQY